MKLTDPAIIELRKRGKNLGQIAAELGIARQAPYMWKRVPPLRVLEVARITGLTPTFLRPDLYPGRRRKNGRR